MEEAMELVVLNDGDAYSDVEGANVLRISNPDVIEDVVLGTFTDASQFSGHADDTFSVKGLLGVFSRAHTLSLITEGVMDPAAAANLDSEAQVALRYLNEAVLDLLHGREVHRG